MAEEKKIEQQDNQEEEQQKNQKNNTKEELLNTLAEEFNEFYQQNKEKFKNSSLTDIFFQFLENQQEENPIIKKLEEKL
jgi:hypothetical protein